MLIQFLASPSQLECDYLQNENDKWLNVCGLWATITDNNNVLEGSYCVLWLPLAKFIPRYMHNIIILERVVELLTWQVWIIGHFITRMTSQPVLDALCGGGTTIQCDCMGHFQLVCQSDGGTKNQPHGVLIGFACVRSASIRKPSNH